MDAKVPLLTLQQLRYFLAAAELGSFTAAADALRVSQPAVADQVRRLERLLGVELFVRLGRGIRLTDVGREFEVHARRIVTASEEATAWMFDARRLRSGTLGFGVFGAPAHYKFADLIERFLGEFPGVRLRLLGRNSAGIAEDVRNGAVEAGLVVLPVDGTSLDVRPIARDEVVYATAEPKRARSPITMDDFVEAPLILYEAGSGIDDPTRRQLSERVQALGLRIMPRVEVEHIEMALQLVARGLGDTYVPRAVAESPIFPAKLQTTRFSPPLYDTFAFVSRQGDNLSQPIRELIRRVEGHMQSVAEPYPPPARTAAR